MKYLALAVVTVVLSALAGCTPANRPPAGEAVAVGTAPQGAPPPEGRPRRGPTAGRQVTWFPSFSQAKDQATKLDRPLLVNFTCAGSAWCEKLNTEVWPDPKVVAATDPFICVEVDGDANPQLVKNFKVSGYPTIMAVEPGGKVLGKAVGYRDAEAMERFLNSSH